MRKNKSGYLLLGGVGVDVEEGEEDQKSGGVEECEPHQTELRFTPAKMEPDHVHHHDQELHLQEDIHFSKQTYDEDIYSQIVTRI